MAGNCGPGDEQDHGAPARASELSPASIGAAQHRLACELPADLHKRIQWASVVTAREHARDPTLNPRVGVQSLAAHPCGAPFLCTVPPDA